MGIDIANGTKLALHELAKAGMVTSISYAGLKLVRDYIDPLRPEDGAGGGLKGFCARYKNLINIVTYPASSPLLYSSYET